MRVIAKHALKLTWIHKNALFLFYLQLPLYQLSIFIILLINMNLLHKAKRTIHHFQVFHSPEHITQKVNICKNTQICLYICLYVTNITLHPVHCSPREKPNKTKWRLRRTVKIIVTEQIISFIRIHPELKRFCFRSEFRQVQLPSWGKKVFYFTIVEVVVDNCTWCT